MSRVEFSENYQFSQRALFTENFVSLKVAGIHNLFVATLWYFLVLVEPKSDLKKVSGIHTLLRSVIVRYLIHHIIFQEPDSPYYFSAT